MFCKHSINTAALTFTNVSGQCTIHVCNCQFVSLLQIQNTSVALQMDSLTERNSSLLRHVAEAESANAAVKGQLQEFHQKLRITQGDNRLLQQQIAFFHKQQKVSSQGFSQSHPFQELLYVFSIANTAQMRLRTIARLQHDCCSKMCAWAQCR